MHARIATPDDLPQILEIVLSHTTQYGVDIVTSGIRDRHIDHLTKIITNTYESKFKKFAVVTISDDRIVGVCTQTIYNKAWWLHICYIRKDIHKNGFGDVDIGAQMFDLMCQLAEERGVYKLMYVVRDSGTKRLDLTISRTTWAKDNYTFQTLEELPPFTKSKIKFVENNFYMNGENKKPVIVRFGKVKD